MMMVLYLPRASCLGKQRHAVLMQVGDCDLLLSIVGSLLNTVKTLFSVLLGN